MHGNIACTILLMYETPASFCAGQETGLLVDTEPGAGSDLRVLDILTWAQARHAGVKHQASGHVPYLVESEFAGATPEHIQQPLCSSSDASRPYAGTG